MLQLLDSSFVTTLATALLVAVVIANWWKTRNSRFRMLIDRLPKGPPPVPFFGNTLELVGGFDQSLQIIQGDWPAKYGEIFIHYMGSSCCIDINSPELMEPILNNPRFIDKGLAYRFIAPWLGDGLLLSTGAKWKSRRRLLTPAFHYKILDNFIHVFNKQSRIFCDLLEERGYRPEGIDLYPFITNCTLDIICETAMGTEIHAQTEPSDYVEAVYSKRATSPWLHNDFLFSLSPVGREHNRGLKTLHDFTERVIRQRRQQREQQEPAEIDDAEDRESGLRNRKALLDLLLDAAAANGDYAGLSDQDVREEIDTFMFEGHDTTASSIAWFLYNMAQYPEHQELVWKELNDIFGDSDRECTQQDCTNMPYLECCIKESVRMYTTVVQVERTASEDTQVGDYLIPKGANVALMLYALHHNPRIYPDPMEFRPQRFSPEESIGRHPYAFIPFSAGPRNCIGQKFAFMEEKVVLSTLLRRFQFSLSPLLKKPVPSWEVVLRPTNGIQCVVTRRDR